MVETAPAAMTPLYEQPMLVVDPGMHTAMIISVAVDAAGRVAVTGSDDKTVRVWSLADGKLKRTIRMPAGPDNIGKIYAVALNPDGDLVAAGGWTKGPPEDVIARSQLPRVPSGVGHKARHLMMRSASELIANADFPCGFCRHHCARFDGRNIAKSHCAPVYWCAVTSSSLPTSPSKNGGLNRLSANLNAPRCG